MRRFYILIFALSCLLVLAGCSDKPYKSESSYTSGYNDYLDAVERAIGDSGSEYHSCTKEGCIKAVEEAANVIKEEIESNGGYSTVSIQPKDFDNLKTTLKLFEEDYDNYIDPDDYEAEPLDEPYNEDDYLLGVEHAKADLAGFFEENGDYVVWSEARGWILDHMYAMDSVDLNDCINDFDFDCVDEDSWFDIDKVKHSHNLIEQEQD